MCTSDDVKLPMEGCYLSLQPWLCQEALEIIETLKSGAFSRSNLLGYSIKWASTVTSHLFEKKKNTSLAFNIWTHAEQLHFIDVKPFLGFLIGVALLSEPCWSVVTAMPRALPALQVHTFVSSQCIHCKNLFPVLRYLS